MNGKVVKVVIFLFVIGLLLLGYQLYRYYGLGEDNYDSKILEIDQRINELNSKIEANEKEKKSLEEEKTWKMEVYKTWEKEVKKMES